MQSLAERTRAAVRADPVVYDALRAGVVNYAAAARRLDVEGDADAVATALARFEDDLADSTTDPGGSDEPTADDLRVRMHRGVGPVEADGGDDPAAGDSDDRAAGDSVTEPLLVVGDVAVTPDAGDWTAVVGSGPVDLSLARRSLGRLDAADVTVHAAGYTDAALVAVVDGRDGATAVRAVEGDLD